MKSIFKTSIKILLLCFTLTLVNCERNDELNVEQVNQELIFKKIYFDELNQNNKLTQKLIALKENKSLYAKGINDSILDFTVNDEVANYVEYENGNHSYSFSINRSYATNTMENLLLVSNSNNDYNAYVVDYNITKEEYENSQNTPDLTTIIDYYSIDYDSSGLRSEYYECSGTINTIVWMDGSLTIIFELSCSSGGSSTNNDPPGDTNNDPITGDGENISSENGSGGVGNSTNYVYVAPIKTIKYAQEIIDAFENLDFETQQWLNNPENISAVKRLNTYLNNNNYSDEAKEFFINLVEVISQDAIIDIDALSFVLEAKNQDKIYNDFDSAFLNSVNQFTNIDLLDSANHDPVIIHYLTKCAVLKALNPTWSDTKILWEATKDVVHISLDIFGLVPVVGEVADLLNGGLYLLEGDGVNATLSFAATVPFGGWTVTGAKYAVKLTNTVTGQTTKLVWKATSTVIGFGRSGQLRKVLGLLPGNPQQAHHIVPWALRNNEVVQKAANSLFSFHMNDIMNGIAVAAWRNQPNHNLYNQRVQALFDALPNNLTPDEAFEQVNILVTNIRSIIINNPNVHLNDLIF